MWKLIFPIAVTLNASGITMEMKIGELARLWSFTIKGVLKLISQLIILFEYFKTMFKIKRETLPLHAFIPAGRIFFIPNLKNLIVKNYRQVALQSSKN